MGSLKPLVWTSGDVCPGFQSQGGIPCVICYLCDPQIHLWCDTCWLYRGQYGSQALSIHLLADVSTSIGGGSGREPTTVSAARSKHSTVNHSATPARRQHQNSNETPAYELNIFPSHNVDSVKSVADLGFSRGGCANPKGGAPTYYLPNFSRKLHENEEILAERGGACPWRPP